MFKDSKNDPTNAMEKADKRIRAIIGLFIKLSIIGCQLLILALSGISVIGSLLRFGYVNSDQLNIPYKLV